MPSEQHNLAPVKKGRMPDEATVHRMMELSDNFVSSVRRRALETCDDELMRSANAFEQGFGDAAVDLLSDNGRPSERVFRR